MTMDEVKVETGVDALISLLQKHDKMSLKDVAIKLGISEAFIQSWVDFLVEERILGVEYKFTKPYIYLNQKKKFLDKDEEEELTDLQIDHFKKNYFEHARKKLIPENKIPALWKLHISSAIDKKREFFIQEATKHGLSDVETLFLKYKEQLVTE